MNVEVKNLEKSQVELKVEMPYADLEAHLEKAAQKISQNLKVDGFRNGKIPFEIVKQKVGEMALLEEAARIAINATLSETIKNNVKEDPIGQPQIEITKLAPKNALEYKITLALLPEITLGEYKDLGIKREKVEVEEAEIEKALSEITEMRVAETVSDKAIKEGDKALVDIQMFLDNVPLEGGQSQDSAIIIGKDYIVPGFDKNLIGLKKGDTKEFKLPYPKDHHMKNIAGKVVDFKVTVKEVYERQVPELNDETAQGFGLKSLAELKENIKKSIVDQKEKNADQKAERAMLEKILEKSKFGDLADTLVKYEGEKMLSELEQTVAEQGGKFPDYLQSINKTREQLTLDLLPEAIKRVKTSLLLKEIAKTEKIKIKEDEIKKQISEMKNYYKSVQDKDPRAKDALKYADTPEYKAYVYNVLSSRQILDKLKEWNIAKK